MLIKLSEHIVRKRKPIIILFSLISVLSIFMIPKVRVNYNMSNYLPEDMSTKQGITIMDEEFGLSGSAQVMLRDVSIVEAMYTKEQIAKIPGIQSVTWLDDMLDITQPLEIFDQELVKEYYTKDSALFLLEFVEDDYSLLTDQALDEIRQLAKDKILIRGPAASAKAMRDTTTKEIVQIVAFVLPVFLIILLLSTSSWFESVLFIVVIGISVMINMGTNVLLPDVSFMTQMSGAVLQFAIAMDYSIFLLHRFAEERALGADVEEAMKKAVYKSFSSISASALTTVAGFVALMFMRYRIGMDMGLVLAKGIFLSLISVLLLLPAITIFSDKLIEKTQHKSFLPSFLGVGRLAVKLRYLILALVMIILIPAYKGQSANHFLYGESSIALSEGTLLANEESVISEAFGPYNPMVLLVPSGNIAMEAGLADKLQELDTVDGVQALVTIADSAIAREVLPREVVDRFETENYSRFIIFLATEIEGEEAFMAVDHIEDLVSDYYDGNYILVGASASVGDIKDVVEEDFGRVNIISILAVGIILLFTFRSLLLPFILVFDIETSVWINMSVPYFMNSTLNFIGYMIVSSVQLGGTVDYAILLTNRYLDNRKTMEKKKAAMTAISDAGGSILTSAAILGSAGFILGGVSSIAGISELGILIGRGALLSLMLVLFMLPLFLVLFDGVNQRLSLKEGAINKLLKRAKKK